MDGTCRDVTARTHGRDCTDAGTANLRESRTVGHVPVARNRINGRHVEERLRWNGRVDVTSTNHPYRKGTPVTTRRHSEATEDRHVSMKVIHRVSAISGNLPVQRPIPAKQTPPTMTTTLSDAEHEPFHA